MHTNQLIAPFFTIVGTIIGGAIVSLIERNKRRYELKKDTYFELLDTFSKLQRVHIDTTRLLRFKGDKRGDLDHTVESSEDMELNKAFYEAYDKLKLLEARIQLFNDYKKIEEIIDDYLKEWVDAKPPEIDDTMSKLIEVLKEEL
jgi:hypothetical protein